MGRTSAVALVCLLVACAPREADQLMVRVIDGTGGRLVVPDDLDAFEVRVSSLDGPLDGGTSLVRYRRSFRLARPGERGRVVTLPQTLAVVPANGGGGTVRVDVYGLKNGRVLQHIHRIAAFGVGLVELPPFALTPLCFGVECPPDQTCDIDGVCRDAADRCGPGGCDAGTGPCGPTGVACGDECRPYDDDNCGACGRACPEDERCVSNVCTCAAGTARCAGACVDLQTDPGHCGACGTSCSGANATVECRLGACHVSMCNAGWEDCDGRAETGCESPICVRGAACTTSCGSTGTASCGTGRCATTCRPPAEACNGVDDDCDGTVDECAEPGSMCFRGACAYPPLGCESVHVRNDHLYAVCDEPADWFLATDVCLEWGGYLLVLNDAAEESFARGIAPGSRWIGYTDYFGENAWQWQDRSSGYSSGWCAGQPSAECCYPEYPGCYGGAPGEDQDCAVMGFGCGGGATGWDDQHCCWGNGFVCEAD